MFELAELPVLHHPEARNQYLKDRCAISSAGSKRSLKVFAHVLFTEKSMWIAEISVPAFFQVILGEYRNLSFFAEIILLMISCFFRF